MTISAGNSTQKGGSGLPVRWMAVAAVIVVAIMLLVFLPPYLTPPNHTSYASETVAVAPPSCECVGANGPVSNYSFDNSTWSLGLVGWYSPAGGGLTGNGTEPNGHPFWFNLSGLPAPGGEPSWTSPDGVLRSSWNIAFSVTIMVRTIPPP